MSSNVGREVVESFLKSSMPCVETIAEEIRGFEEDEAEKVCLFYMDGDRIREVVIDGGHFFLRSSVEYTNPQLTVEEVQGILAARLIEVCGNYHADYGLSEPDRGTMDEICELLSRSPSGKIAPFLLNTDDVEPDRYSINPLRKSIMDSGQSAFPSVSVETRELEIVQDFIKKYERSLISKSETELIERHLDAWNRYIDMVDAVKYEQLENLSEILGVNLCIPSLRMPLTALNDETGDGPIHYIIRESHVNYESIERIYNLMGRSIKKRRTLLTIAHSEKGFGSKRAARGRVYFDDTRLKGVRVTYKTTRLYPNAIDPNDTSIAEAEDEFTVEGDKLTDYDFRQTPSSPQFILYSLVSPEDAALWHGVGAFGASQLIKSYTTTRIASARSSVFKGLKEEYGVNIRPPLQLNVVPENMWVHPVHRNIDASIGCVEDLGDLVKMGMKINHLPNSEYLRT